MLFSLKWVRVRGLGLTAIGAAWPALKRSTLWIMQKVKMKSTESTPKALILGQGLGSDLGSEFGIRVGGWG